MKSSKNFFKLEQKNGEVFWNKILIKAMAENRISLKKQEYDITPNIQTYFTNTHLTTKNMDDEDKLTIFNFLTDVGFYNTRHRKGMKSAWMQDALYNLPKEIDKIRNPPLPATENEEDSSDLQEEGVKIIVPSNIIDIYT